MFFQNIDSSSTILPFLDKVVQKDKVTEEDLYPFIDAFKDTRVTDIVLNVSAQSSVSPSDVVDDCVHIAERKTENGHAVDYSKQLCGIHDIVVKHGIDPFAVWFRRIRETGKRSYLSVRMNDCHCPYEETCHLRPGFFYKARENGWMNGEEYGYFCRTLNYKYPEVRAFFLDYIREQILRYDVDGLELDFMREILCFDYLHDDRDSCVAVMNDFMRGVKRTVGEAEEKHGHKIEILVRLTHNLEQNLIYGFDPVTWEKEGLMDRVIPSPRFQGSENYIPVQEWKKALPKTPVTICIEGLVSSDWGMSRNGFAHMTAAMVRGHAAHYLAEGSDGIYTYNMFGEERPTTDLVPARDIEVQNTLGSREEIVSHPLRFCVINQDEGYIPQGANGYLPLPVIPNFDQPTEVRLHTGKLPESKKGRLILGFTQGSPEAQEIRLNGKKITDFEKIDLPAPKGAFEYGSSAYAAPLSLDSESYVISFKSLEKLSFERICWIEIEAI